MTATAARRRPFASDAERRTWVPDAGLRIIACVGVESVDPSANASMGSNVLWELVVRRMERCIRPSDWMCMLGGNRIAVSFGNGGHRVSPSVLGGRLARALGDHLSIGGDGLDVHVLIGISAGPSSIDAAELTAAALAALRSARERLAAEQVDEPRAIVTVTHVPAAHLERDGVSQGEGEQAQRQGAPMIRRIVRRVSVPLDAAITEGSATATSIRQAVGTVPRVLVVDPEAGVPGSPPRLAVEAVAAVCSRLGARVTVAPSADPERVILDLYVAEPHAAVVVLDNDGQRRRVVGENSRPWERPARLVRALREAGTPVIAVGIGASAAAVAACIEQGAVGLLDPDDLANELSIVASAGGSPSANGSGNGNGNVHVSAESFTRRLPAPFAALVGLTPSERKVLFHMMEGRSASDIAEALVVSLPTVRSHIRSILRKLNVNSQLAAVAIANGALPDALVGA